MRTTGVVLAATICLVGALFFATRFLDGPLGPIPGGELRAGKLVTDSEVDWSFIEIGQLGELQLLSPLSSRTVGLMVHDGQLYVPCDLGFAWRRIPIPQRWFGALVYQFKHWHEDISQDGRVLLRIDGKRFARQAVRVTDPNLLAVLHARFQEGIERFVSAPLEGAVPIDGPNEVWFFRMDPRSIE